MSEETPTQNVSNDSNANALTVQNLCQKVIAASPNLVYIRDRRGRYSLANPAYAELINQPLDLVLGATTDELGLTSDEDAHRWQLELTLFANKRRHFIAEEKHLDRKTDEIRWFRTVKIPLLDPSGETSHVLTISSDLTERKRAEDTVRQILEGTSSTTAEDFFHSLVYQLASALKVRYAFVGQLIEPERTSVRTLAVYRDGQSIANEEYPLTGSPTERILNDGLRLYSENVQEEFPHDSYIRTEGLESYMGVPVRDSRGRIHGILAVMDSEPMLDWAPARWIMRIFASRAAAEIERLEHQKEHQALQKQLLEAQKMEAIGQLAAGVAHDLNNALGAVVGHLELLNIAANLEPEWRHSVQTALKGCERASSLIEQLLGFSRHGKYHLQVVKLRTVVDETLEFLNRIIAKNITIEIQEIEEGLCIHVDHGQAQQALTNIVINAAQAMPDGGKIIIILKSEAVSGAHRFNERALDGNYVLLSIRDTGSGISQHNRERVFEPFFTTKKQGSGTGLGLSMVYGTMQNHGGWVTVQSELGKGSEFTLYFPSTSEPSIVVPVTQPETKHAVTKHSILLIDDEQMLVDLGVRFLERAGFIPFGFSSASKGLSWFEEHSAEIGLAIIDMKMPDIDGKRCFEIIRSINPQLPIILLSGYTSDETTQQLIAKGSVEFFQKPLKYADLIEAVRTFLSS